MLRRSASALRLWGRKLFNAISGFTTQPIYSAWVFNAVNGAQRGHKFPICGVHLMPAAFL
jgi:hypothetical protein